MWLGPCNRQASTYYGAGDAATSQAEVERKSGIENGRAALMEIALGGVGLEGFMGFVMAWTLVFNLVGT